MLAWHSCVRHAAALADGFERRRTLGVLADELDAALEERPGTPLGTSLSFAVRRHDLPEELLRRPLQELQRSEALGACETREALLARARALALPEGRLYLRLTGQPSARNEALSDSLALALQLTAWLVDLRGSFALGRLLVPVDELARAGVPLAEFAAERASPALRRVLQEQIEWTRGFYIRGWELCHALGPWRGRALAFVLRWHAAKLSALEAAGARITRGGVSGGWVRVLACASTSLISPGAPRLS